MDEFSLDPRTRHTQWSLVIGGFTLWSSNLFSQSMVQRISSMKSIRDARIACLINVPLYLIYGGITALVGLSIYAFYSHQKCDPLEGGLINNRNQLSPYFVLHAMTDLPGMAGLFMGVLCCGSLSSLSSGINAMAANTVEDLLLPFLKSSSESTITFITKLCVIFYGSLAVGLAYLAKSLDGTVTQMAAAAFGAFGSPLAGVIILGASVPWGNKIGALAGIAAALFLNILISFGNVFYGSPLKPLPPIPTEGCFKSHEFSNSTSHSSLVTKSTNDVSSSNMSTYSLFSTMTDPTEANSQNPTDPFFLFDITYEWYTLIGSLTCFLVGLIVSYFTKPKTDDDISTHTDARYIFPFLRNYWGLEDQLKLDRINGNITDIEEYKSKDKPKEKNGHLEMDNLYPLLAESHQTKANTNVEDVEDSLIRK